VLSNSLITLPQRRHLTGPPISARRVAILVLFVWLSAGCQPLRSAGPRFASDGESPGVLHPTVRAVSALVHDDPEDNPEGFVAVAVTGAGLGSAVPGPLHPCGSPGGGAFLDVSSDAGTTIVPSTDSRVVLWTNTRIVVKLHSTRDAVRVRVCTPTGASDASGVTYYTYDHFALPLSEGTNPGPLALALDDRHRVWIIEEFHLELKYFDPTTQQFASLPIPRPIDPGPFATTVLGEHRTQVSQSGEALVVDQYQRVWFTQGGAEPYPGDEPDHSRVVSYDPRDASGAGFRVFNVPGDHNSVFGVAWDARRHRIWFTEAARQSEGFPPVVAQRARLVSFDPGRIPFDNHFDFAVSTACAPAPDPQQPGRCSNVPWRACLTPDDCVLAEQICPPDTADDSGCYHEYELPGGDVYQPGHVVVHPDGSVWYTAYWGGNHIGRLDPESGGFSIFPLPQPVGFDTCDYHRCLCASVPVDASCTDCCVLKTFGTAPWDIKVADNGDVVFSEYVNAAVARFDSARLSDPACRALDKSGSNPCIQQLRVPGTALVYQVHSIALGSDHNVWFTEAGPMSDAKASTAVGYVRADWDGTVLLPPLSLYPFYNSTGAYCPTDFDAFVSFTGAGIAFDGVTGDLWFADYCRKRLGRLREERAPPPLPAIDPYEAPDY
jgi:streptogramin lyase